MKITLKTVGLCLASVSLISLLAFLLFHINFFLLAILLIVPGFLLSFFFDLKEITFLERIIVSFGLWTLLLIVVYAVSLFKIPVLNYFSFFILFLVFPAIVAYINKKRFAAFFLENKNLKNLLSEHGFSVLCVVLLIFAVIFMFQPLLYGDKIAQTDANLEQWWGNNIKNSLTSDNTIYMWTMNELSGYPIYTFETFFTMFKMGIFGYILSGEKYQLIANNMFLLHYLFYALGIYALLRRLKVNRLLSLFVPLVVFFTSTILHAPLNGAFRPAFSNSFFPITFLFLFLALKEPKYWIMTSLFMLIVFFHHPMYGVNISIIIALTYLIYKAAFMIHHKSFKIKKEEIKYLSFAVIAFVIIFSFWIIPFLSLKSNFAIDMNQERALAPANLFLIFFTTYLPVKLSIVFEILAVLGALYCIYSLIKHFKTSENQLFLISLLFSMIILFLPFITPGVNTLMTKYLPTGLYLYKIYATLLVLFIAFAFNIGKNKAVKYVALVILIGIILANIFLIRSYSYDHINETIQNNNMPQITDRLKSAEYGKFFVYGIYTTTAEPAFQMLSGKPMIGLGTQLATNTMLLYKLRTGDGSGKLLDQYTNPNYYLNIMRQGFVKYLFFFKCDAYRQGSASEQILFTSGGLKNLYSDQCTSLDEVLDSNFVEKTKIAKINVPESLFYSINGSWKVNGFKKSEDYNLVNPDITVEPETDLSNYPKPESLKYNIVNDEEMHIYGTFNDGDWIVIKQDYFPRFHAYENGKPLQIKEQYLGMTLILATKGTEIVYKYESYPYEIILAVISATAVLLLFLIGFLIWKD